MLNCIVSSMARLRLKPASPPPVQPLFPEPGEQSVLISSSRNSPSHLLLLLSLASAAVHCTA